MTVKRIALVLALLALLTAAVSADDTPNHKGFAIMGVWGPGPGLPLDDPALLEATGLDEEALKAAILDGATLTELIEANEGDVETVIAGLVAEATDAINENAAAAIDGLDEAFTEALNETYRRRFPWWRQYHPLPRILRAWDMHETILEATGLDAEALLESLMDGTTVADLIEANEGDVDVVVASLVEQATEGIESAAAAAIERSEDGIRAAFESDLAERRRRGRRGPRGFFGYWSMYSDHSETQAADAAPAE